MTLPRTLNSFGSSDIQSRNNNINIELINLLLCRRTPISHKNVTSTAVYCFAGVTTISLTIKKINTYLKLN